MAAPRLEYSPKRLKQRRCPPAVTWIGINRIRTDTPEEADALIERFRHRSGKVDLQPGFVRFEAWREESGTEVMILTRWQRREDFLAWTESEAFRHAHARVEGAPGRAQGELYEVVIG
jgi:heme-degrading monooxygenase HmoA